MATGSELFRETYDSLATGEGLMFSGDLPQPGEQSSVTIEFDPIISIVSVIESRRETARRNYGVRRYVDDRAELTLQALPDSYRLSRMENSFPLDNTGTRFWYVKGAGLVDGSEVDLAAMGSFESRLFYVCKLSTILVYSKRR